MATMTERNSPVRVIQTTGNSRAPEWALGPCRLVGGADTPRWGYLEPVQAGEGEACLLLRPGCAEAPAYWAIGPAEGVLARGVRRLTERDPDPGLARRVAALAAALHAET